MAERPSQPFVTSVRVERSSGPHEYVTVWLRGQNVGTLCVGQGDGDELRALLLSERSLLDRQADASEAAGFPHLADALRARRAQQGYADPVRPHEPDDEVFAAPPGVTVRDATDAEQVKAIREYAITLGPRLNEVER